MDNRSVLRRMPRMASFPTRTAAGGGPMRVVLWAPALISRPGAGPGRSFSLQPRILEAAFWRSLVPKPLRAANRLAGGPHDAAPSKARSTKTWNRATFFIVIFVLIGSMSIQMITLRNKSDAFKRRSDVRIGLLRELLQRIQAGEEVDVEKVLGTGDAKREAEWKRVLREIENEKALEVEDQSEKDKPKEKRAPLSTTKGAPSSTTKVVATAAEASAEAAGPSEEEGQKAKTSYFF